MALTLLKPSCDSQKAIREQKCTHYKPAFCIVHVALKESNVMQIKTNRKSGFTLVEIMIVVAIIGLLAAIAIPNFVKARTTAQQNACIANLKQVSGAIEQWALETKAAPNAAVAITDVCGSGKHISVEPKCPAGGNASYVVSAVDVPVACPVVAANPTHTL